MAGNPNFDKVASTTLQNYTKQMADNISVNIPLFHYLSMKNKVTEKGGRTIVEPLMYAFANAQSYSGSDVLDISSVKGISAAEYNWKQTDCPIVVEEIEVAKNRGKEQILDLIESLTMQAELSMYNKVGQMLFGDGTGNIGKDMLGLEAIVAVDPTADVLGGINSATDTWWRNITNTSVGSFASGGITAIETALRQTTRGMDKVDLIVTNSTIFGYIQSAARTNQRFTESKLADLGFESFRVNGIDVIWDANCPADRVYGLNSRYLNVRVLEGYNFSVDPFVKPANQQIRVAHIQYYAQLVTNRRDAHFVLSGITA